MCLRARRSPFPPDEGRSLAAQVKRGGYELGGFSQVEKGSPRDEGKQDKRAQYSTITGFAVVVRGGNCLIGGRGKMRPEVPKGHAMCVCRFKKERN